MRKLGFAAACALVAIAGFRVGARAADQSGPPPVEIEIGSGKTVTITIRRIRKDDLVDLAAAFFSRGQKDTIPKLKQLLDQGSEITLLLTSR